MPNWKNGKDYEFTQKLKHTEWAWEFLRRSTDYRKDWKTAKAKQKLFFDHQGSNLFNTHLNPHVIFDPPIPEGVNPQNWALQSHVQHHGPLVAYGLKWHLVGGIQDPAIPTPPMFQKMPSAEILSWEEVEKYYSSAEKDLDIYHQIGTIAVVGIDLSRTQSAIENDIKKLVKIEVLSRGIEKLEQKHFKKKVNWRLYLRIMDAQIAGESQSSMAKVLLPEKPDAHEAKITINQYIHKEIARLTIPDEIMRLANEPG